MRSRVIAWVSLCLGISSLTASEYTPVYVGQAAPGRPPLGIDEAGRVAWYSSAEPGVLRIFDGQSSIPLVFPTTGGELQPWKWVDVNNPGWILADFYDYYRTWNRASGAVSLLDPDLPQGTYLRLTGVNSSGLTVGYIKHDGDFAGLAVEGVYGFSTETLRFIPARSSLLAINDAGFMVGSLSTNMVMGTPPVTNWYGLRACLFSPGGEPQVIDQRPPDTNELSWFWSWPLSEATHINEHNWVAGYHYSSYLTEERSAFLYDGSELRDLGEHFTVHGLNNAGDVVGAHNNWGWNKFAFIYRNGAMMNLNTLIPPEMGGGGRLPGAGWSLLDAVAINDRGQIVVVANKIGLEGGILLLNPEGLGKPPTIAVQPSGGGLIGNGNPLHLSVTAGGDMPFSYQWLKDGEPIEGKTAAAFDIAYVRLSDAGTYQVRVSNQFGVVVSSEVVVQVPELLLGIVTYAGIVVYGDVGHSYRIEYKENLTDPAWLPVPEGTLLLTNSPQTFIDTSYPTTKRVYQAIQIE